MNTGNRMNFVTYINVGKKKIKWYKRLLNIITGHKERNYIWELLGKENNK